MTSPQYHLTCAKFAKYHMTYPGYHMTCSEYHMTRHANNTSQFTGHCPLIKLPL